MKQESKKLGAFILVASFGRSSTQGLLTIPLIMLLVT
jgi:hypothetical protein